MSYAQYADCYYQPQQYCVRDRVGQQIAVNSSVVAVAQAHDAEPQHVEDYGRSADQAAPEDVPSRPAMTSPLIDGDPAQERQRYVYDGGAPWIDRERSGIVCKTNQMARLGRTQDPAHHRSLKGQDPGREQVEEQAAPENRDGRDKQNDGSTP